MAKSAVDKILYERPAFVLTVFLVWILVILYFVQPFASRHRFVTLHKILKNGQLTVITRNNAQCYYLYRDEPMGFEYELAKEYADYLGVSLKIKVADNWEAMVRDINRGVGAVIAAGISITPKRAEEISFTDGYMAIQPYIITHRNNTKINNLQDLTGKTIDIVSGSVSHKQLEKLRKRGANFFIQPHGDIPAEELIQKVSDREIEITVVNSQIAILNRRHYPWAVMRGKIGDEQQLGWAVYPEAHQLRDSINAFFRDLKKSGRYDDIYNKYYGDTEKFDYIDLAAFHRRMKARLSRYSTFIKAAARKHGFDWRLIVAQIYQESHLNPWAKSRAGAKGLMQLLPGTASSLGVKDVYNPVENINAGVQHLKNLYEHYDGASGDDRLLISLAAYNIGQGHISDARRLAAKKNLDPDRWDSLEKTLPLLRYKKYYKRSKFGYCLGTEPLRYTKQIMIYYDLLKRKGIEYGTAQLGY